MSAVRPIGVLAGLFDGRLDTPGRLAADRLAAVPARRGVFLLADGRGRPVLLATAGSLRARLRGRLEEPTGEGRRRSADLREVTRRIHWKLAGSVFEADWLYLELAGRLYPGRAERMCSWKPPWFVGLAEPEGFAHFRIARGIPTGPARAVGPFETRRAAGRFVEILHDAFDLCREVSCLRQSPRGRRCPYGQMGRCLCPCDGTTPLEAYRRAVAEAAAFAAGRREEVRARLAGQMRAAAAELKFEHAAALKVRLERLAELDRPEFRHVAPAEAFRFLVVQPAGRRGRAKVFLVDGGVIRPGGMLRRPLGRWQMRAVLGRMRRLLEEAPSRDDLAGRRMGLLARALYAGPARGGLIVRWSEALDADTLGRAVAAAADGLGLSARRRAGSG